MTVSNVRVEHHEDGSATLWWDMDDDVNLEINDFTGEDLLAKIGEYLQAVKDGKTEESNDRDQEV